MIFVLDTSVLGFIEQLHPPTMAHLKLVAANFENKVVTTIVTVDESLTGWLAGCHHAKTTAERVKNYSRMWKSLQFLTGRTCLPFDAQAAEIFDHLRLQKLRIGTNDLAIAAITLSVGGSLVTRNVVDFERVPDLRIEDWTK
jgi:tRNA(fMet)-specific endonuclease VapC